MPKKQKTKKVKKVKKVKKIKSSNKIKQSTKIIDKKNISANDEKPEIKKIKKQPTEKRIYNLKDFVVYPKHGVGKIIGTEAAIASKATKPKLSFCEVSRNRSLIQSNRRTSVVLPKNLTFSAIPRSRTCCSALSRSGPSPNINKITSSS